MKRKFQNIFIAGMATTLPECEIDNMSYADQYGEDVVKKQIKVTGITKRRVVQDGQSTLDLVLVSAERVLEHTGWTGEDIDVLIFASGYTSCKIPATAYLAQKQLGIKNDCIVMDVNLACTGTVDGLLTAMSLLQQCLDGAKALLLVGETTSIGEMIPDKTTAMLSSDCGAAVALEKKSEQKEVRFYQKTDGSRYEVLVRKDLNDYIHMDGMEVFQFAIDDVVNTIHEFFDQDHQEKETMDYFVIHQAQKFIVDKVARFAKFPKDKVINSYPLYGNTGGASDVCTLCANAEKIRSSDKEWNQVFMTGFGAGLSWGMVTLSVRGENILPVVYSSQRYEI